MTYTSIILSITQARQLQREDQEERAKPESKWQWPGKWKPILNVRASMGPGRKETPERLQAGILMVEWGCQEEQIREQLNWRPLPMKRLRSMLLVKQLGQNN